MKLSERSRDHHDDDHNHESYGNIINDDAYGSEDIIYFELSRAQIETAIRMARDIYVQALEDQKFIAQLGNFI